MLFDNRLNFTSSKNKKGIEKTGLITKRPTNPHGRPVCTCLRQNLNLRHRIASKLWFEHQILHLVTGDKHLRQHNHISASGLGSAPSLQRLCRIACKITDCCVELRHGQPKSLCHLLARSCQTHVLSIRHPPKQKPNRMGNVERHCPSGRGLLVCDG